VRWAPHLLGWWIAVLFMIGSACFAGAAAPGLSSVAPASVLGGVFFAGSLFFTSAAYLQYVQSINAAGPPGAPPHRRLLAWQPGRIDWWACAIQLAGTVWFNINTFDALRVGLTTRQQNWSSWRAPAQPLAEGEAHVGGRADAVCTAALAGRSADEHASPKEDQ
jgi:hypothetical protein